MIAAINAQITIEFKILKFFREEFSRAPYKARLCISERRHHDKSTQLCGGQNRGQTQTQNRGLGLSKQYKIVTFHRVISDANVS